MTPLLIIRYTHTLHSLMVWQPFLTLNPILQTRKSQVLERLFSAILRYFSLWHSIRTLKNRKKQFCLLNDRVLDLAVKNQSVQIGCQMCRVCLLAFSPVSAYRKMSVREIYLKRSSADYLRKYVVLCLLLWQQNYALNVQWHLNFNVCIFAKLPIQPYWISNLNFSRK